MQIKMSDLLYNLVNGHGMTADDIAKEVGIQPETVGKWLAGTKNPGKESSITLLELYKKQNPVEDEVTLSDDVEQTDVHHASANDEPPSEPELAPEVDAITDSPKAASETNNESEDTANMEKDETTDKEQAGQSIRSKTAEFFKKPVVRNAGKVIAGALVLGAAAAGGAYGEKRRGANTPV